MEIVLYKQAEIRDRLESVLSYLVKELKSLVPDAKIEEIGSSSIPGSITKGDLDLALYVSEERFHDVKSLLIESYEVNEMEQIEYFYSFKGKRNNVDFGIQLCTTDNVFQFLELRKLLISSEHLVSEYNEVKKSAAHLSMDEYRAKKSEFIESVLKKS